MPTTTRPTAQDLAIAPSRGELELVLAGVTWPDGRPMRILLRARTHQQRAQCERAGIKAGLLAGLDFDGDTYAVYAALYGIVDPQLTESQLSILWDLNGHVLEQIVETLEWLETQSAAALRAELARQADLAIPDPPPVSPARKTATPRARKLDRGARPQAEPVSH